MKTLNEAKMDGASSAFSLHDRFASIHAPSISAHISVQ